MREQDRREANECGGFKTEQDPDLYAGSRATSIYTCLGLSQPYLAFIGVRGGLTKLGLAKVAQPLLTNNSPPCRGCATRSRATLRWLMKDLMPNLFLLHHTCQTVGPAKAGELPGVVRSVSRKISGDLQLIVSVARHLEVAAMAYIFQEPLCDRCVLAHPARRHHKRSGLRE